MLVKKIEKFQVAFQIRAAGIIQKQTPATRFSTNFFLIWLKFFLPGLKKINFKKRLSVNLNSQ